MMLSYLKIISLTIVVLLKNARMLIEEVVDGTPYESHFKNICTTIKVLEKAV